MSEYIIKTEEEKQKYASGMEREKADNKIDFSLIFDGPMYKRWAQHLTAGAKKYKKRNWMQATGQEELDRFMESAARHFYQWFAGETDEDHAAAVIFNINGAEHVKDKNKKEQ